MVQLRSEKWKKQIRSSQREEIKRIHRDRVFLLDKLNQDLILYKKCSLISGQEQHLDHHCFFDCESFAVEMHQQLFRLMIPIGIESCKSKLKQCAIASTLYSLTETIENKTVECDEIMEAKHYYSREKVLESIADILCFFTQDYELVSQYGSYIISMFATALNYQTSSVITSQRWKNKIIGLSNLFEYNELRDQAYRGLHQSNLQLAFQRYCCQIIDNRIDAMEISVNFFALFRKYLEYQQEYTENQKSRSMLNIFSQLITHIFSEENRKYFSMYPSQFVDEFLRICEYFHFKRETCLLVLKNPLIYKQLSFAQLFNSWTYNCIHISIKDFTYEEFKEILLIQSQLDCETKKKYSRFFAGSLINILMNAQENEEAIRMIWKCLEETNTVQTYFLNEREQECFSQLRNLLSIDMSNNL